MSCAILLLALACGDKDTPADSGADADTDTVADSDTDSDADGDSVPDPDTDTDVEIDCSTDAWADQTGEDRNAWMTACVLPPMTTLFQSHDADAFADFGCGTCHPAMGEGDFSQPSQVPANFEEMDSWPDGYFAGDGSGLMEQVTVDMANILGEDLFDPETGEGFACFACHQADAEPPK